MARIRETEDTEILAAARKMFTSRGLSVTVKQIASSIGISEGVVFQRFGSKSALIEAALAPAAVDLDDVVQRAGGHPDPARAFEEVIAALFAALRREAPVSLAMLDRSGRRPAWCGTEGVFLRCLGALSGYLRREQQAGRIAAGAPEGIAFVVAGALHHAAAFEAAGGPTPHVSEHAIRRMARLIWQGLASAPRI